MALNFLSRDAVTGNAKKIHHIVPAMQWNVAAMERRADARVNVMTAPLAAKSALAADAVKLTVLFALRALKLGAETGLHQMRKASVIIRKPLHELLNRCDLRHGFVLHA